MPASERSRREACFESPHTGRVIDDALPDKSTPVRWHQVMWWEVEIPDSGLPLKFTETEKGWRLVDPPGTFPKIEDYVKIGPVAHSGERRTCNAEAAGS